MGFVSVGVGRYLSFESPSLPKSFSTSTLCSMRVGDFGRIAGKALHTLRRFLDFGCERTSSGIIPPCGASSHSLSLCSPCMPFPYMHRTPFPGLQRERCPISGAARGRRTSSSTVGSTRRSSGWRRLATFTASFLVCGRGRELKSRI